MMPPNRQDIPNKAIILIVAVVVLVLLTVLAMTMVGIGLAGKIGAMFYIEKTQSEFLATSAIEIAMTKILYAQNKKLIATLESEWVFPGEDFNRNGMLDGDEDLNQNGILDTANLELLDTIMPSFPNHDAETIIFNKKIYFPSIIHKEWAGKNINSYTFIKAIDTSSLICVNNIKNPGLRIILNNLADYLNVDKRLGDLLFDYLSSNENVNLSYMMLEKIWHITDKKVLNDIFRHLSLYCYEDGKVLAPSPSKNLLGALDYQSVHEIISLKEINESHFTFGSFAPLNINLAPSIIIKSTLKNISALSFENYKVENVKVPEKIIKLSDLGSSFLNFYFNSLYKPKSVGFVKKVSLTEQDVEKVVEEFTGIRSARLLVNDPLAYNWDEFFLITRNLISKNILTEDKSSLIFANANPNLYTSKVNPPLYKSHRVDRLNLIDYTTTYTFIPHGIFKIEAYNVFLDKNNQVITRNYKSVYAQLYQSLNETTISDFTKGVISSANLPTLNGLSLNIGPYPVSIYNNLSFPDFDGFLELSPLIPAESSNTIYDTIHNGYGPFIMSNLVKKNKHLKNALQFRYPDLKKISLPDYSLLWDGVNFNLLDVSVKNSYIKIFETLFKIISESDYDENPVNLCFWFKLQSFGDITLDAIPLFNISGRFNNEKAPFFFSFFTLRKNKEESVFYNLFNGSYNLFDSQLEIAYDYFISNEILSPITKANSPYLQLPFLLCLSFSAQGLSVYINGNNIQKQKDDIDTTDIELKQFLGNIDIEKTISNVFFNGTLDYVIYIFDGEEKNTKNEEVIKKMFPQRFCMDCDNISYTTKLYQIYTLDKNCIVNLYWTDNITATNLPDVYLILDHFSLFEADILDEKDNKLNENVFDTSVGVNDNRLICADKFKIRLNFTPVEKVKIIQAPVIDDLYI
ncbi:MAG: hypothetical protein ACK4NF_04875, partial [Planctomycetota bacterium]